ncbi:MAG: hypothetical protein WBO08_18610 [Mycobacterium sp.]
MADTIWLLEWAAPFDTDTTTPPTAAHRTEPGARAAIAAVAADLGIDPGEITEAVRPSGMMEGSVGALFFMLRTVPLA